MYFVACDVTAIGLLWHWGAVTKKEPEKTESRILLVSFIVAFVVGSAFDVFLNTYSPLKVPQLASVFIIIPIGAFLYCLVRYGLMLPDVSRTAETGTVLSEVRRRQVYFLMGVASAAGGTANLLLYFIWKADLEAMVPMSFVMFGCALLVMFLPSLPIEPATQDKLLAAVSGIFVLLMFNFTKDLNGADIVWSFPLLLMVLACVFSRSWLLVTVAAAGIATQTWLWVTAPTKELTIGPFEHMSRLLVYGFAAFCAFIVNRIYTERLSENEEQARMQSIISRISSKLAVANSENLDELVTEALETAGVLYGADTVSLVLFPQENPSPVFTYRWQVGDGSQTREETAYQRRLVAQLREKRRLVALAGASEEEWGSAGKQQLPASGRMSSAAVYLDGRAPFSEGYLEVRSHDRNFRMRPQELDTLQIIASNLVNALARVESEREVYRLAYYDYLTGLPNRFFMRGLLRQAISEAEATGKLLGIVLVDLHSFKEINETIGHDAGDVLLKKMAERISECVGLNDAVCRFGGDEFAVIVNGVPDHMAVSRIAEKIIKVLKEPVTTDSQEFFVNSNAGISLYPVDGQTPEELIKAADLAMNASKETGVNRYAFYSRDMSREIEYKTMLINGLHRALEKGELTLYYQPQVDVCCGSITGVEALIRWNHPVLGMVPPSVFIPLAEQSGLIHAIGEWVLRTACQQNRRWQDKGLPPLRVAVNLSPEQFKNPNLVHVVERVLSDTGLSPQYLELEITENVAGKEAGAVLGLLEQLKALGVSIAIDDFGSEYSSLGRLRSMPVDRLKIDLHLVRHLATTFKDEAIIKAILYLARNLGINALAEGVETQEQLELLTSWNCREVQGFYYFRPMPADEMESVLVKGKACFK